MTGQEDTEALVSDLDRVRADLYALLRSKDATVLTSRPPSGEWSIIENVRHLLFAEQLHLGKFLPDGFEWSRAGLSGRTGSAYADVGTEPSDDLEEVLTAWDTVRRPIIEAVNNADERAREGLARNLKHLRRHVEVIEELLGDEDG